LEQNLAVLIDFENIAAGTEKENLGRVDIGAIFRRLKVRGRIVVARSYGDWGRFARFKQTLLEQGVTMVELTSHGMQDKNRADIALVVDAMELAFTRSYVDTFVVISGDSDFTPLVLRLKELNKRVIGVGTRGSTSKLLVQATDEFIFYDGLIKKEAEDRATDAGGQRRARVERDKDRDRDREKDKDKDKDKDREREKEREREAEPDPTMGDEILDREKAFGLLAEAVEALRQDTDGWMLASVVKSAITRREPSFSESDLGFSGFGRFLEAASERGVVAIRRDDRSGGYRVDAPGEAPAVDPEAPARAPSEATGVDAGPRGLPELSPEATELRDLLTDEGFDPMSRAARAQLVGIVLALHRERRDKRRKTNLHTLRSELLRRVKQERQGALTVNRTRAGLRALMAAGAFVHSDGQRVRSEGASFQIHPDEVEPLLDAMDAVYLRTLRTLALDWAPSSAALAELLRDDPAQTRAIEEALAWISVEAQVPGDAEVLLDGPAEGAEE